MATLQSYQSQLSTLPTVLPATFLKEITNDFSPARELSRSVFGTVYKGVLPDGRMIAVKRLDENAPVSPRKTFDTEVSNLMGLKHENIVELVGFCQEVQKKVVQHNGRYVIVEIIESCLCYTYLSMESLDKHLDADTMSINWETRFKIIKGICKGLHFLHKELDCPIIHMSLLPNSIWLDDNWVPKIADFGLSRLFGQEQSRVNTINVMGQNGYMAPEYLYRGEISTMSDIYSLGMLIIQITTGEKNCPNTEDRYGSKFVYNVHQRWKTDEQIIYNYPLLDPNGLQQVKSCIVIGLKCVEFDRNKRPSITDIVNWLYGKYVPIFSQMTSMPSTQEIITPMSTVLLSVHPEQLCFPFKPDKLSSCPLRLTNMTDDCVAVRLLAKNAKRYMAKMPLCAVVPPRSTYTLVVTMREQKKQPPLNSHEFLSLESSVIHKGVSLGNADLESVAIAFNNFFREAKESVADKVHELTLKLVSDSTNKATSDRPFQYEIEIISTKKISQVMSVDLHPTKPWILTSHLGGDILIWDYHEQEIKRSFDITQRPVYSAKFIEREQWLVAGDGDGTILVCSYDTDEVTAIDAHEADITSLAVHPTKPIVISSSSDQLIKLWDWEKAWECTRVFVGHCNRVTEVNFNPRDSNSFASASLDHTIKIWDISSSESKITLSGHPDGLLCIQNYTGDTRQYLITGSWDGTAQIWDLEMETCVHTLKGHINRIGSIYHHPELPVLITGSHDGTVRLWNSSTYRLENIIGLNLGAVYAFGYIKDVKRVVVACHRALAIVEMNWP